MRITLKLANIKQVQRKFARLADIGRVQSWLGGVGEIFYESHKLRHEKGIAPDGFTRWTPLAPLTRKQKKRPTKLHESGDMLNSLSYQVSGDELHLGFSDEKAIWHHHGTRPYQIQPKKKGGVLAIPGVGPRKKVNHPGLPARELLGVSNNDGKAIYDLIDSLIDDAIES